MKSARPWVDIAIVYRLGIGASAILLTVGLLQSSGGDETIVWGLWTLLLTPLVGLVALGLETFELKRIGFVAMTLAVIGLGYWIA